LTDGSVLRCGDSPLGIQFAAIPEGQKQQPTTQAESRQDDNWLLAVLDPPSDRSKVEPYWIGDCVGPQETNHV
jgi:hypothetical protein